MSTGSPLSDVWGNNSIVLEHHYHKELYPKGHKINDTTYDNDIMNWILIHLQIFIVYHWNI